MFTKIKLADCGKVFTGNTPSKKVDSYWGNEYPFIKPPDLNNSEVVSEFNHLSSAGLLKSRKASQGTVLVSCIGTLGKIGICTCDSGFNQQINAVDFDSKKILPEFGFYAMLSQEFQNDLQNVSSKTTLPIVNKSKFQQLEIPIPPTAIQNKCILILNNLRNKVLLVSKQILGYQNLKSSLMAKLFSEGLRDEALKETEIGLLPKSWKVARIGDHTIESRYGTSEKGTIDPVGYPVLRINSMKNGYIQLCDLKYSHLSKDEAEKITIDKGDFLFNRTNSLDKVGQVAVFDIDTDKTILFASYLVRLRFDESLDSYFAMYYLSQASVQSRIKTLATRAVGQANINASKFSTVLLPIPPLEEQIELVKIFRQLDSKISILENKHLLFQSLFDSLLNQLMSQQIDIENIDFNYAENT